MSPQRLLGADGPAAGGAGIPVTSFAGAGWLLNQAPSKPVLAVGRENDVGPWLGRNHAVAAMIAVVVGMLFLSLHLELNRSLLFFFAPLRMPMLSLLWIALCGFLLSTYRRQANDVVLGLLALFSIGLALKLLCFDLVAWHVAVNVMRYAGDGYSLLDGAMRLLDFAAVIAFLACGYYLLRPGAESAGRSARFSASPPRPCCSSSYRSRSTRSSIIFCRECGRGASRSCGRSSPWP